MQDATAGSQHPPTAGYSLQEAAMLLGIGVNTLRRRISAGQVQAERVQRPQGYVWRVYLEGDHPPIDPTDQPPNQEAPRSLPHPPTPLAQAEALSSLVRATVATVLGPLVTELAASREANERQAQEIADLREERGQLTTSLAVATEEASRLKDEREQIRAGLERRVSSLETENQALRAAQVPQEAPEASWRRWWPVLLGVLALVGAVVLVVWIR